LSRFALITHSPPLGVIRARSRRKARVTSFELAGQYTTTSTCSAALAGGRPAFMRIRRTRSASFFVPSNRTASPGFTPSLSTTSFAA
jgi:hypothetical protein